MIYKEWLKEWLEIYVRPTLKIRTFYRYTEIVKNHLIKKLGDKKLSELTPAVIQKCIVELSRNGNMKTQKGLSPCTVNSIINVIQGSLKAAFELGYIKEYHGDKIKRPRKEEKMIECFSVAEQQKIQKYVLSSKKQKLFGIVLCMFTGMRIGELLALRWEDIDLKNETITICKSCYDGKDENGKTVRKEGTPKTKSSIRMIHVPKQLKPVIREYAKKAGSPYVVSEGNKTFTVRSYQQTFEHLLKRIGIAHRGFHSLRHTFATRALECGMDVKTLSEILGHKSPTVTLERYAHSLLDHKKDMMNKLGKMFEAAKKPTDK